MGACREAPCLLAGSAIASLPNRPMAFGPGSAGNALQCALQSALAQETTL